MKVISIDTPRLLLRLPEAGDAAPFVDIHQDPEALAKRQVVLLKPIGGIDVGLRNVTRMLRHWQSREYGQWAVVEKASGHVIGCVGLYTSDAWPGIELSWILERSQRGKGFGTESCRAALEWAWQTGTIDHIISLIAPDNLPSIRIAMKIGERFERADVNPVHGETVHVYGIRRPASATA